MLFNIVESRSLADCRRTFAFIRPAKKFYPDLDVWFFTKVIPGVVAGDDILLMAEDEGRISGVALAKSGSRDGEKKLRCVRVAPDIRCNGLATLLITKAIERLDCKKPLVSVPEECIHQFLGLFVNRFGFTLTKVVSGLYRPGKLEYEFNGRDPASHSLY